MATRIYFDNAATSWPKPESVYRAVEHYQRAVGAPTGRGIHRQAQEAGRYVEDARNAVARLLGITNPQQVILTYSGTDSLNMALKGLLNSHDHVVTSVCEHNSVLRPLAHLKETLGVEVSLVDVNQQGQITADAIRQVLRPHTRLVALTHASNVTGTLQPVAQIAQVAHEQGALLLLDAAQTMGHLPFHIDDVGADLVAASGHKGLLGPLGTGFLYIGPGMESLVAALRHGGTGTQSHQDRQPQTLPEKYEAGNHNVPGLAGLAAGTKYVCQREVAHLRHHVLNLTGQLIEGLLSLDRVRLYGPTDVSGQVGVVSIQVDGHDPSELALALDATFGIQVRAGMHCAALIHRTLGTAEGGGTLRLSPGPFNTVDDVDQVLAALREITTTHWVV